MQRGPAVRNEEQGREDGEGRGARIQSAITFLVTLIVCASAQAELVARWTFDSEDENARFPIRISNSSGQAGLRSEGGRTLLSIPGTDKDDYATLEEVIFRRTAAGPPTCQAIVGSTWWRSTTAPCRKVPTSGCT